MNENGEIKIVDASVRPVVAHANDIREWMEPPWKHRAFAGPERYQYAAPTGDYWPGAATDDGSIPGADAERAERHLRSEAVDVAILLPRTRGLLPNVDLDAAICKATNRWLAETWLGEQDGGGLCRGSIRVCPGDPAQAIAEIERWAGDERMVQIAVPMQSHAPYGQRRFLPVWQAAAQAGLPVAILTDGGSSVDFPPTPVGYVRYAMEYSTLYPLNFSFHLASFIAEGVFERLDDFKVVFADGGFDMLAPLVWRLDKDWRPTRVEMPWTARPPHEYLPDHVRFCTNRLEGPDDSSVLAEWLELSGAAELLMFASNYPQRDYHPPGEAFARLPAPLRERIMSGNARELYGLPDA